MIRAFDRHLWTPQLIATSTNPSLGNGLARGWWTIEAGGIVSCWFGFLGGSGASNGSGNYRIVPPVPPAEFDVGGYTVGTGRTDDSGSTFRRLLVNTLDDLLAFQTETTTSGTTLNAIGSGFLGMGNGRRYVGFATYPAA